MVSKMAATKVFDRAQELLTPLQMGVGTRGGAEAVIHAVQRARWMDPNINFLQVDLTNAFGMAERGPALDLVAEHIPYIYNWCLRSYGGETVMMFGQERIYSTKGWHQGDPLAPYYSVWGL